MKIGYIITSWIGLHYEVVDSIFGYMFVKTCHIEMLIITFFGYLAQR